MSESSHHAQYIRLHRHGNNVAVFINGRTGEHHTTEYISAGMARALASGLTTYAEQIDSVLFTDSELPEVIIKRGGVIWPLKLSSSLQHAAD